MKSGKFYFSTGNFLSHFLTILTNNIRKIINDVDPTMKFTEKKIDFFPFCSIEMNQDAFDTLPNIELSILPFNPYKITIHDFQVTSNTILIGLKLPNDFTQDFQKSFPPNFCSIRFIPNTRLYDNLSLTPKMIQSIEHNFSSLTFPFQIFHHEFSLAFNSAYSNNEHFQLSVQKSTLKLVLKEDLRLIDSKLINHRYNNALPQSRQLLIPATASKIDTNATQMITRDKEIEDLKKQLNDLKLIVEGANTTP